MTPPDRSSAAPAPSEGAPDGIVALYDGIMATLVRTLLLGAVLAGFAVFMGSSSQYGVSGTGIVPDGSPGDALPVPLSFHVWAAAVAVPLFLATQIRPAPAVDDRHDQVQAYVLDLTTFLVAAAASTGSITAAALNLAHHERLDVVALAAWPLYAALASTVRGDRALVRPHLVQRDLASVLARRSRLEAHPGVAPVYRGSRRTGRHGHRRGTGPPPAGSTRPDAASSRAALRRRQLRLWGGWVLATAAAQLAWFWLVAGAIYVLPPQGAAPGPWALLPRSVSMAAAQGLAAGVLAFLAVETLTQWHARRQLEAFGAGLMAGCLGCAEVAGVLIAWGDGLLGGSQQVLVLLWAIGSVGGVLIASGVYAPTTAWGRLHQWRSLTARAHALRALLPTG